MHTLNVPFKNCLEELECFGINIVIIYDKKNHATCE